jgi:hypothetical protein
MKTQNAILPLALALAWPIAPRAAEPTPAPAPVSADAVWIPDPGFPESVHAACDAAPARFGECFVAQMEKAGAPPPALAFAQRTGNQGYAQAFRDAGVVDIAWAEFPFRANENQVCFLVNGRPPWIDVDDGSRFDRDALAANAVYSEIKAKYPNVTIFPGHRAGPNTPRAVKLAAGGQRFSVDYDADGAFVGTKVMSVRAKTP